MRLRQIGLFLIILSGLISLPVFVHSVPATGVSGGAGVQRSRGDLAPHRISEPSLLGSYTNPHRQWQPPATPLPVRPGNMLTNGDFEGEYIDAPPSSRLAAGWSRWWVPGTQPGINHEPEYKEEYIWDNSIMVYHGDFSQKYFNNFATHTGGIYQRVLVPEDSVVRFSIWARVWSSDCGDPCYTPLEPCHPDVNGNSNGEYRVSIGIDPTGGTEATADTVEWTPMVEHYDEWLKMVITTTAQSSAVTVFTQGTAKWPVANNFSFWDDARLELLSAPINGFLPLVGRNYQGAVAPSPTATPTSTVTLTPTSLAGPTATSTAVPATPTPTTTATPTGTASPTATETLATFTPSATTTVTPSATPRITCGEVIDNGGFESDLAGWSIGDTAHPADYSTVHAHGDSQHSMRLGIEPGESDTRTYSYISQAFRVPENATSAQLTFFYFPVSQDIDGDYFDVMLADAAGQPLAPVLHTHSNLQSWIQPEPFDLTPYAGRDVQLLFNVYNNGSDGVTAVWLDDVSLTVCGPEGISVLSIGQPQILQEPVPGIAVWLTWVRYSADQIGRSDRCEARCIEWVYMKNRGDPTNMAGWTLEDDDGNIFTFPDMYIPHDNGIRVWTTDGEPVLTQGYSDLYWGSPDELLEDAGDKLILRNPEGESMSEICYSVPDQRNPGPCPAGNDQ
ncbi:MAG: hypothetical protein ACE5HA_06955 [Anaerolineae bacterium]